MQEFLYVRILNVPMKVPEGILGQGYLRMVFKAAILLMFAVRKKQESK